MASCLEMEALREVAFASFSHTPLEVRGCASSHAFHSSIEENPITGRVSFFSGLLQTGVPERLRSRRRRGAAVGGGAGARVHG